MKRLLLPLLALLIPSAHATNYVECEAIRAVIARNGIQKDEAIKNARETFRQTKVKGSHNGKDCNDFSYGSNDREQCQSFELGIFTIFGDEYSKYKESIISPYKEIDERATKDFKKRGCYWF